MTPSLRVAMVALDFHRRGGSEGRTAHLVDRLVADGHEVHLVGSRIQGPWDRRVIRRPIRTVEHPHWLEVLLFCQRAAVLVGAERFDVVHNQIRPFVPGVVTVGGGSHRYYLEEVLPRERGRLRAALKRVMPLHRVLLALEQRGFNPGYCPFIIANSHLSRAGILKYYPIPSERVIVAYNGVDATRFSPMVRPGYRAAKRRQLGIGPDEFTVLLMGQGFTRKGLGPLLEAVGALRKRGVEVRLVVAGRGGSGPWMAQAGRLGLGARVTFAGHVSDPEAFYAAADVFALPTYFDPFANATLEAMASGLPVVTSRDNGAAEILHHGVDGLVVERPDDVEGLADALASLQDPVRRASLGEQARQTALKYPWEGPLEATLRVYREVVEERGGAGAPG